MEGRGCGDGGLIDSHRLRAKVHGFMRALLTSTCVIFFSFFFSRRKFGSQLPSWWREGGEEGRERGEGGGSDGCTDEEGTVVIFREADLMTSIASLM